MLTKEHRNENVYRDHKVILVAGVILFISAISTFYLAYTTGGISPVVTVASLLVGGLFLMSAVGTLNYFSGFTLLGTILSGINTLIGLAALGYFYTYQGNLAVKIGYKGASFSLSTYLWIVFVSSLIYFLIILKAYLELSKINVRIKAEQNNPLVTYYHELIPILVRVMEADGDCDRREHKKIKELCRDMHISRYEMNLLIRLARPNKKPIEDLVKAYFKAAEKIGRDSSIGLMAAVMAVAEADGIFVEEEIQLCRDIGKAAGMDEAELEGVISHQKVSMDQVEAKTIYRLLGVSEDTPAEKVEESYEKMIRALEKENYVHISQKMVEYVLRRRGVIEKAYQAYKSAS